MRNGHKMVCVGLWYHSGTIPHDLVVLALVLVIFTIFAAVRLHVQLVRFGRFVRSERAGPGRGFGFTYVMRHLNHAKTNRTPNGARTKKWRLFDVSCTRTWTSHYPPSAVIIARPLFRRPYVTNPRLVI